MKCFSVVILFSILSIVHSEGSYPEAIDIGLEVVTYLAKKDETVFCTAVLVSDDKGICISGCLSNKDLTSNKYYAHVGLKGQSSRTKILIKPGIDTFVFESFNLNRKTGINSKFYSLGLPTSDNIPSISKDTSLMIYGYLDGAFHNGLGPTFNNAHMSSKIDVYSESVTFTILSQTSNVYHQRPIWKSSPIFYGRRLYTLCEYWEGGAEIVCSKVTAEIVERLASAECSG